MKRSWYSILGLLIITLFFSLSIQPAYSSGSDKEPEFQIDTNSENISDSKTVREMAEEFLDSKEMHEGPNEKNGRKFFVGIGYGSIGARIDHPRYIQSRINAFDKAFLASKQDLAEYLATEIKNDMLQTYKEGGNDEDGSDSEENVAQEDSVVDKLAMLANVKLDKMLREEGVDPDAEEKEDVVEAVAGILSSEQFQNFTKTAAKTRLSGVQAYKCFEGPGDGKGYQIAVISIYSDTLREMASAIYTGKKPQGKAPKKPIKNQIPTDKDILLGTFGVQQKIDENGDLVIVAYAQGAPISESSNSITKSYRKAKIAGLGYIRKFAGENYATTGDLLNSESTTEYDDATKDYTDKGAFDDIIRSTSDSLSISGIQTIKKWTRKHPINGKVVTGVVLAWSPGSSAAAQSLKVKLNTKPKKRSQKSQSASYERHKLDHEGLTGSGAEADDEAF